MSCVVAIKEELADLSDANIEKFNQILEIYQSEIELISSSIDTYRGLVRFWGFLVNLLIEIFITIRELKLEQEI